MSERRAEQRKTQFPKETEWVCISAGANTMQACRSGREEEEEEGMQRGSHRKTREEEDEEILCGKQGEHCAEESEAFTFEVKEMTWTKRKSSFFNGVTQERW